MKYFRNEIFDCLNNFEILELHCDGTMGRWTLWRIGGGLKDDRNARDICVMSSKVIRINSVKRLEQPSQPQMIILVAEKP